MTVPTDCQIKLLLRIIIIILVTVKKHCHFISARNTFLHYHITCLRNYGTKMSLSFSLSFLEFQHPAHTVVLVVEDSHVHTCLGGSGASLTLTSWTLSSSCFPLGSDCVLLSGLFPFARDSSYSFASSGDTVSL